MRRARRSEPFFLAINLSLYVGREPVDHLPINYQLDRSSAGGGASGVWRFSSFTFDIGFFSTSTWASRNAFGLYSWSRGSARRATNESKASNNNKGSNSESHDISQKVKKNGPVPREEPDRWNFIP